MRVFFKVLFSRILGWIFFQLFNLVEFEKSTLIQFHFYFLGSFSLFKSLPVIQEASDETHLLA